MVVVLDFTTPLETPESGGEEITTEPGAEGGVGTTEPIEEPIENLAEITKKRIEIFVNYIMKSYICNRKKYYVHTVFIRILESCLSGRKDMFAKHAYGKLYQGFESLTLRFLIFRGVA